MPYNVTLSGITYTLPDNGDNYAWGNAAALGLKQFFQAIGTLNASAYQAGSGATLPLTALLDFGPNFGLKALFHQSETASAALSGILRLAAADFVSWRNHANSADMPLGIGIQNELTFNSVDVTGHPQAVYGTSAGQSIPHATVTVINYDTVEVDTQSAVTTGASWKFTVPAGKGGLYAVRASVQLVYGGTASTQLFLYKNGSLVRQLGATGVINSAAGASNQLTGATNITLAAGDYIDIRVNTSVGAGAPLDTAATANTVCIHRTVS